MATKIKAFKVSEERLKKNSMPAHAEMMDGASFISPIKMRAMGSYPFHLLEDVKGNIYLISNDDAIIHHKLYDRNLGVTETKYMLDGVGINQIKAFKAAQEEEQKLAEETKEKIEELVEENHDLMSDLPQQEPLQEKENSLQSETEGEEND